MFRIFARWENGELSESDYATGRAAFQAAKQFRAFHSLAVCQRLCDVPGSDEKDNTIWVCLAVATPKTMHELDGYEEPAEAPEPEDALDAAPPSKKPKKSKRSAS